MMTATERRNWWQRLIDCLRGRGSRSRGIPTYVDGGTPNGYLAGPPGWDLPTTHLTLDSRHPYLRFTVGLVIRYSVSGPASRLSDAFLIARAGIQRRAGRVSGQLTVAEPELLRAELEAALHNRLPVDDTGVTAWAHCTGVEVDPDERAAIEYHERAMRRLQLARWQHEAQEYEIAYLGDLITDPRRATAWWFTKNLDKVEHLAATAATFTSLRNTLAPAGVAAGEAPDGWEQIMTEAGAVPAARHLISTQAARIFAEYGQPRLAERVRRLSTQNGHVTTSGGGGETA